MAHGAQYGEKSEHSSKSPEANSAILVLLPSLLLPLFTFIFFSLLRRPPILAISVFNTDEASLCAVEQLMRVAIVAAAVSAVRHVLHGGLLFHIGAVVDTSSSVVRYVPDIAHTLANDASDRATPASEAFASLVIELAQSINEGDAGEEVVVAVLVDVGKERGSERGATE